MNKIILSIGGMTCSACSSGLEKYLKKQTGIDDAIVNLVMATATISYTDNINREDIDRYIKEAGFESLGIYDPTITIKKTKKEKENLIIFTIISIILMYISMGHMINLPSIPLIDIHENPVNYAICLCILAIIYLIYGFDIIKSGYKNLIHQTPNMDTLVGIGVVSSFLYSIFSMIMIFKGNNSYTHNLYFESTAIVIYFVKLGRYIDSKNKDKTKEAIKRLVTITPKKALLKKGNKELTVTLDEIKEHDILICKPGMKIAVDGKITKGESHFEEAFLTGESTPVKKTINDEVIAGAVNYEGYIEYEALHIGKNSAISQVVKLVVEATNTKPKIARLADKASSYFVPAIIIIAILSFIGTLIFTKSFNTSINTFVTILVVSCPCALGLATPLAVIVSEGTCASHGILVKSSETLESAHKIDTIIFDKTGTLTYGNLKISEIHNFSNYKEQELLKRVASIEGNTSHPISYAFTRYLEDNKLNKYKVEKFTNLPGLGIKGTIKDKEIYLGNQKIIDSLKIKNEYLDIEEQISKNGCSIVYVIEDNKIIALIGVKDILRKEAKKTISLLNKYGKDVIMLTGDNKTTANIIAKELGIKNVIANVIPTKKAEVIKKLKAEGKNVMMVGDGINDAPSLALCDIGVSISSGTDIAADSSNVILLNDDLTKIPALLEISKKTISNIKQNLFWAFFYNACMIPIAIGFFKPFGLEINPMIGSIAMTLSSLTVVLNALRLKNIKIEKSE